MKLYFLLFLLSSSLLAQPPVNVDKLGLTMFSGASHCHPTKDDKAPCAMRYAVGYRLVEWSAGFLGHGDILGFLSKDQTALGIGHRFPDYFTGGMLVSFTAGPEYSLGYSSNGLGLGHAGVFVMITVRSSPKK